MKGQGGQILPGPGGHCNGWAFTLSGWEAVTRVLSTVVAWPPSILTEAPGWHVEDKLEREKNELREAAMRTQEVAVAWTRVVVGERGSEDGVGFANGNDTLFLKSCITLTMRKKSGHHTRFLLEIITI